MKTRLFIPIVICLFSLFLCTQCKKDKSCKAIIHVYFSNNGIDAEEPAAGAYVAIGQNANYADFAKAEGYTNEQGIFEHSFLYEASLEVYATSSKDVGDVPIMYAGATQIKLEAGETTEIDLLIIPVQ
ncbi:MAG TPA: hypothetical protein P5134_03580 [Bacteroidales bacterium]|nr:hypothetical protein [Bacteroidales bacterium]HOS57219.1 hypothetical protein [Bacteroidales bacterium]HQA86721.1 hypothetical protein [Bacteroidales bacterium]HRR03900.1 hypothetical protein [Bacteroidales bacterium]HRT13670.1 hypothetical protein [Bacteroidales bacterium]